MIRAKRRTESYGLVRQLFVDRMADQELSNTLRDKQLLTGNEDSNAELRESSSKRRAASIPFPFTLLPFRHWRRAREALEPERIDRLGGIGASRRA
jgi:hypothetical protein